MLLIGRVLVGVLLLVLGRRLYWLFVAGLGFLYGLKLAPLLLPEQSETMVIIVALILALAGALIAVVATKIALAIIGFVAGGGLAVLLLDHLGIDSGVITLGAFLIAGLIGAVLLIVLFDWTLIVLSSVAGATLIVMSMERFVDTPPVAGTVLILALAAVGAVIQAGLWRRKRLSP
jgi:hypothetical protein